MKVYQLSLQPNCFRYNVSNSAVFLFLRTEIGCQSSAVWPIVTQDKTRRRPEHFFHMQCSHYSFALMIHVAWFKTFLYFLLNLSNLDQFQKNSVMKKNEFSKKVLSNSNSVVFSAIVAFVGNKQYSSQKYAYLKMTHTKLVASLSNLIRYPFFQNSEKWQRNWRVNGVIFVRGLSSELSVRQLEPGLYWARIVICDFE